MPADWTPDLTLNHEVLDTQHVGLFRKLDAAASALDGPRPALDAALAEFAEALMEHIAVEERLMDETLYPERVRHKSAHELFVADFEWMRAELAATGSTENVAEWIRHRTPEWLAFHTRVNDVPLAAWLARRRAPEDGDKARDARRYS